MPTHLHDSAVFLNCPFDAGYRPIFHAAVFAIQGLGFAPRSALEEDDGSEVRLTKIERIIEECRFGIHDLSAVELDKLTRLPRFNMPLELGLFLGCRRFGGEHQHKKTSLILDREPYRYRTFISDISGQDIHAHRGDPEHAIAEIRDWLRAVSKRTELPGASAIVLRYRRFQKDLPHLSASQGFDPERLTFLDLSATIADWLQANR